jgi:Ca-activated chloride channel family protein
MKNIGKLIAVLLLWQLLAFNIVGQTPENSSQEESPPARRRVVGQGVGNTNNQSQPQDYNEGETLKIGVQLVQVIFSAVDQQNRLITDLKQSEVEVYDNGQPQQLELFQRSNNLPMVLSVLIDVSGSQEFLLPDEKTAVATFFDSFFREGKDYGSLLTFQGETSLAIGLTSNLQRLKTALQRIKRDQTFRDEDGGVPNLGTALYDAIDTTAREVLNGKTAQRITTSDASSAQSSRAAIRRAIFVLTDGVDTASQMKLAQSIRAAQRYGITVYALGMGDRFHFANVDHDVLDQLCQQTGGRAYYPRSEGELRQAFEQISAELSSQYILAYYPSGGNAGNAGNDSANNNFREIDIKIAGRPGCRVLHRRGYLPDENR